MTQPNNSKLALTWIAAVGLALGALIAAIATGIYSNEFDLIGLPETNPKVLSIALAWQSVGGWLFLFGLLSLIARLSVGSIEHDLGLLAPAAPDDK